jgi:hypothetical protein
MRGSGLAITRPIGLSEAPQLAHYNDLDFKYTFNKNRIKWIKNIYPYSYIFLEIPGLIEWENFKYRGPCQICIRNEEEEEEEEGVPTFNLTLDVVDDNDSVTRSTALASSTNDLPKCIFFGGCVYEILSRKYPNVNLNQFIDPTGDVDILLQLPKIQILNDNYENAPRKLDQNSYIFDKSDKTNETDPTWLNSYICALGKWLVESITNVLESEFDTPDKIRTMFKDIKDFELDRYSELEEYYKKPELGYNIKNIHNLIYIASFITGDMYKIQIIMKIGDEIDHVLEFVYTDLISSYTVSDEGKGFTNISSRPFVTIDINGTKYNIDEVRKLIEGNMDAYLFRNRVINDKNKSAYHKALNHVGRLLYLLELHYQNTTTTRRYGRTEYNYLVLSSNKQDTFFNRIITTFFQQPDRAIEKFQNMIYINDFDKEQILNMTNLKVIERMTIIAEYMLNNLYFFYVKNSQLIKIPFIDIIIGYNKYFNVVMIGINYFIKNFYFMNKLTDIQYQALHDVFIQEYVTENDRIQHNTAAIKIQSLLKTLVKKKTMKPIDQLRHDTYNPQQLFEETTLQQLFKKFVRENLELERKKKAAKTIYRQYKTFKFRKNLKSRRTARSSSKSKSKSSSKSRSSSKSKSSSLEDVPELERSDLDLLFPTRNILKGVSLTSKSKQNHSAKRKQYNSI